MQATRKILIVGAVTAVAAAASIPAIAAPGHKGHGGQKGSGGPSKATLVIKGGTTFQINKYTKDSVHWTPGTVTIASGGTLTISDQSPDPDPHTFSIVKPSQLPKTASQIANCSVCAEIAKAHGINPAEPPSGPPPIPTVDPGKDGFNEPGDSQVIGPHQTLKLTITAKPGTKLDFMCAVHPWMQGVVKVVK
ncbi:MAG TPA: hypothetical protein VHS55_09545 [Solirubrobacteraceae bacterium]|jgi:hypothetical protein|nr:hypothetical protein [Solirubrobacteraceae bacterium]